MLVRRVPLLLIAWLAIHAQDVDAATLYLKDGCTNNGNGAAAGCAASAGAAGAYNSVANLLTAWTGTCAAGDVLRIQARDDAGPTLATANSDDARWHGGLRVPCSGASGNPVIVTNNPGEQAYVSNCSEASESYAACDNATITTAERNYVQIGSTDGLYTASAHLKVRGAIFAHGDSGDRVEGIVIQGVEVTHGWEDTGDGNHAAIRLEHLNAPHVHHNFVHNVFLFSDQLNGSSASGIKLYTAIDAIIEYNTIQRVCTGLLAIAPDTTDCGDVSISNFTQAGGIDDKQDSLRNTHRYNYLEDVMGCLRIQQQTQQFANSTGTVYYGNVCVRLPGGVTDSHASSEGAVDLLDSTILDAGLYGNTFSGFEIVLYGKANLGNNGTAWYNNVVSASAHNIYDDGSAFTLADFGVLDYNAYDSDALYQVDASHSTLAAWQAASGKDAGSHEEATVCGGFVSGSDTNFHVSGTLCDNEGRVGGVSGGAAIEQGAYGVTACVGHLCGSEAQSPATPQPGRRPHLRRAQLWPIWAPMNLKEASL